MSNFLFSNSIARFSLLGVLLFLAGCASNEPLISLPERPAPDAEEIARPTWAQQQPVSEESAEPPERELESEEPMAMEASPIVDTVEEEGEVIEEEPEKKKGFWSFLSRGGGKKTELEQESEEMPEPEMEEPQKDPETAEQEEEPEQEEPKLPRIDEAKGAYKLKTGDILMITLTGSGGLNDRIETVVDEEGGVKLRFIGAVKADGLTPTELEREIEAEYTDRQKIYKEVVARVVVPNRFYFIGREVRAPGRYPIVGKVSLSQAISAAGNFTEWANERKIILVRGNERFEIDFREISRDPSKDILLQPGDSITVERRILF